MSFSLEQLRALPRDELIAEHDRLAQNTSVGVSYFLDELARRDAAALAEQVAGNTVEVAQSSERMEKLTTLIAVLTGANVIAAVASVVAALSG